MTSVHLYIYHTHTHTHTHTHLRDMAKEKGHKDCVHFLESPQLAFEEARRHNAGTKTAEFHHLLSNDTSSGPEPSLKRRKTFSSFLRKPKKKVNLSNIVPNGSMMCVSVLPLIA